MMKGQLDYHPGARGQLKRAQGMAGEARGGDHNDGWLERLLPDLDIDLVSWLREIAAQAALSLVAIVLLVLLVLRALVGPLFRGYRLLARAVV